MKPAVLKLVPPPQDGPSEPVGDIHAYEHEHRALLASRNWASVHINGDRSRAIVLPVNWRKPR